MQGALLREAARKGGFFYYICSMKNENDWKQRLGVVYSTNPDFQYQTAQTVEADTLPPAKQRLIVAIDRRQRAGEITIQGDLRDKLVTLLTQMGYNAKRGN